MFNSTDRWVRLTTVMHINSVQLTFALEQLNDAVELFLDKQSYASAVTLAGAAEEVFGKALEHQGQENVLTWQWDMARKMAALFDTERKNKKNFTDEQNLVRNYLKHFIPKDEPTYELEDAATNMIIRAQENASRLNLEVKRIGEFEAWFYENVVGC